MLKFKLISMVHNCLHHNAPRYLMTTAFRSPMWSVDDIFVLPGVITSLCLDTVSARMGVGQYWNSVSDDLCDPVLSRSKDNVSERMAPVNT